MKIKTVEKTLLLNPVDGERGSITFFDFTDYETFSCTKMGVLYDILNALHDELVSIFVLNLNNIVLTKFWNISVRHWSYIRILLKGSFEFWN